MRSAVKNIWRWLRWPVCIVAAGTILFLSWGVYLSFQQDKTDVVVAAIHAQKITLADVEGKNLPPVPNEVQNNATVAGIDKNNNGIRDDVELAIFKEYPNDAKIRAAELQYAMTEQMFLTKVSNTSTWQAVAEEDGRASSCVGEATPAGNLNSFLSKTKEVDTLVFNTDDRQKAKQKAFTYTTSFGDAPGSSCDVDLNTL